MYDLVYVFFFVLSKNLKNLEKSRKMSKANPKLLKTLYDEPITAQITKLSFFSKSVRRETKKLHKFCEDIEKAAKFKLQARKNKVKLLKKHPAEWTDLSNDQKIIIAQKGSSEQYWNRLLQGPYLEKLGGRLECAHVGIYKDNLREEWGKMVTKDGIYIECGFWRDVPCGKVLIIKPNGTYFEGNVENLKNIENLGEGEAETEGANEGKVRKLRGIFRNPILKRQSMLQKEPDRSKKMCFGKNEYGYAYLDDGTRYKGILSKGKDFFKKLTFPGTVVVAFFGPLN